ncbi:MAG: SurA N-terminal domain-containing protein [Alphaproteobacteria bacterium]|nr:SurA N-terminal domain-containing protein [Alphaproteobacteria bacterium]MDD9920218.1 SurA N-terminal domain-containing protein [Alphaproteobacteria bacterium]
MLNTFRQLGETWFIKFFLILLALSFVAWGVGDYINGGGYGDAIKVGNTSISLQKIERDYNSQRQIIERNAGGVVTNEQLLQVGLPTHYLAGLLQQTSLLNSADELDLAAPETALTKLIQSNDLFLSNGAFNVDTYKSTLRTIGYTPEGYENEQRRQLVQQLMAQAFQPPKLAKNLTQAELERTRKTMDITALRLTKESLQQLPKPTEEQLAAFYQQNQVRYMNPTERNVTVLTLDSANLADSITITEKDISTHYQENIDLFTAPERRTVRHILLQTEEEAQSLQQQLKDGADFTQLAQEHSLDKASATKGGDLGTLTQADTFPQLAKTIFSLEENQISDATESPLGYHILQVTSVQKSEPSSLESVKDHVKQQLQEAQAQEQYFDTLENIEDLLAGGQTLEEVAEELNLSLNQYETFTDNNTYDLPTTLQQAILQQPQGETSNAITLETTKTAFVTVNNIKPAWVKPLEDVRSTVESDWVSAETQKILREKARIVAGNLKGIDLTQAAQKAEVTGKIETFQNIARTNGSDDLTWFENQARTALLRQGSYAYIVQQAAQEEAFYVVQLNKVELPKLSDEEINTSQTAQTFTVGDELIGEYLNTRLAQSDIDYNLPLLQRVFGEGFQQAHFPTPTTEQRY